ncbi:MAG: amidohydrolase family protein [Proteobacteria bacterium]|nr:amidohydrolase family protein [Pseudomonadota bacterium]
MMDPGIGLNAVLMAGHNSIRRSVLGDDYKRLATEGEIAAMRKMTREAIAQGAFGLTAGLEYSPGIWSTTEEVIALVEEIVPSDGVYIPHTRSSGISPKWYTPSQDPPTPPTLLEAVEETIKIGETTGAKTVLTHIKSRGVDTWGTAGKVVNMLEAARQRGVRIYADQYPYNTSGSDGRVVLIPDWAINYDRDNPPTDYAAELRKTLGDPVKVAALRRDIRHEMRLRGGADTMLILDHPKPAYVGMTVGELATICGLDPVGLAIVFQLTGHKDKRGGVKLRGFSMLKEDVAIYAAQPWTATATDGGIAFPEDGSVHARLYGTFPRKIARFARDQGVLSVEAAVRSATSLPAEIMGITDRGIIKEGFHADIVVFDLETLEDRATFLEPHQTPKGIETVIVNGKLVVDNEEVTGALPGVVLSR